MFLTPDGTPFFGGTYFPKQARYGLPGFADLLQRVAPAYRAAAREAIGRAERSALATRDGLPRAAEPRRGGALAAAAKAAARPARAEATLRPRHGGFGGAPKFPHPAELEFCCARGAMRGDDGSARRGALTLRRMAEGGIYDQLGGGFCRYSTDAQWTIPHFEKMLYDNGPLLRLYADLARHRRRAVRASRARHRGVADARDAMRRRWLLLQPRCRLRRRGRASSTSGSATRCARVLGADEFAVRRAALRARRGRRTSRATPGTCASTRRWPTWPRGSASRCPMRRRGSPARARAVRGARDARAAGPRRQDADRLERAGDRRHGARGAGARRAALGRPGVRARRCDFMRAAVARRPAARHAPRRARHLNAYLDDHAFLLAALLELMQTRFRPDDLRMGARARRRAARALRGSRARRLLLHQPRSRAAVPPREARAGQRDAVGQRCRGAGAGGASGTLRRNRATSTPPSARCGCSRRRSPSRRAAARRCSKRWRRWRCRRRRCCWRATPRPCAAWQRALEATYRPDVRVFEPAGVRGPAGRAGEGPRRRAGAVALGVPGHLPACRPRSRRSRRRCVRRAGR